MVNEKNKTLNYNTMKHLSLLFVVLSLLCAPLLATSCTKTNEPVDEPQTETSVTITTTTVEAAAMGGSHSVEYTITNGLDGIDIVAESDVEWVHDIKAADGILSFIVDANNTVNARTGLLLIRYPQVSAITLTINQAGAEEAFTLEVKDLTTTSCSTLVKAKDENTIFITYMAQVDYLYASGIYTAEDLFMDDYNYYTAMAHGAGITDLQKFMLDQEIAYRGTSYISWTNMLPETEYVLYAYGIEFNEDNTSYTLSTPVSYQLVTLTPNELFDVAFDVNITVNGPAAHYEFSPIDWDGKYYLEVVDQNSYNYIEEGYDIDDAYCKMIADTWLSMITETMASGYTVEQLYNIMCLEGSDEFSEMLQADTKYMMLLYAIDMVDGLPQVVSRPYFKHFQTEPVGASDMTLDLKVENLYVRVADVTITPSTIEQYTAALVRKDQVIEGTNEEIMSWLTDVFVLEPYTGVSATHLNSLEPDTEYSLLAFGYYGGTITTDLFRHDFKTEPAGECLNSVVTVNWGGPYSLMELEAADDQYYGYGQFESMGWYAMWSEIVTAEPAIDVFHCIYSAEEYMNNGEAGIFEDLVSNASPHTQLLTGENGKVYVMCAITMDYKGNYSDMWVSDPFTMTYNSSTKRPIEELLDRLNGTSATTSRALMPAQR